MNKSVEFRQSTTFWMHVAQRWVGAALWCLMMIGPITKKAAQSSFLVGWLEHYSWNYAKGSWEGSLSLIEDPSRGPQAHFFDPPPWPESWQRKTTKRNWDATRRLQPLASHYFKLHIVLHCLQSARTVFVAQIENPTKVNEGHALLSELLSFQNCWKIMTRGSKHASYFMIQK